MRGLPINYLGRDPESVAVPKRLDHGRVGLAANSASGVRVNLSVTAGDNAANQRALQLADPQRPELGWMEAVPSGPRGTAVGIRPVSRIFAHAEAHDG